VNGSVNFIYIVTKSMSSSSGFFKQTLCRKVLDTLNLFLGCLSLHKEQVTDIVHANVGSRSV